MVLFPFNLRFVNTHTNYQSSKSIIMNIGKRLKTLRESRELSQENLADELKISQSAYSKWESGLTDIAYLALRKIAEFYGITLSELFEGIP